MKVLSEKTFCDEKKISLWPYGSKPPNLTKPNAHLIMFYG